MRLEIVAKGRFYYDIGLRKRNNNLSKYVRRFDGRSPRYLEDFIEVYGKSNVRVLDYGTLIHEKEYIINLLK